jgi:DNA-binding LacI/PurR family transcriptional regulator
MQYRRPKLDDVARLAGVSRTTASRALNGAPGNSQALRQRVREAAEELGYRAHSSARSLAAARPARPDGIEILIIDADPHALRSKPFYGRVLTGALEAVANEVPIRLRVLPEPPAFDGDPPFGRILINMPVDVATPSRRTRIVALGQSGPGVPFIAPDNAGGAAQAAEHLLVTGRRHLGAVFGPPTPCALERSTGFLAVAGHAGQWVAALDGDFTEATAYVAARRLLADNPRLDAIFAACDVTAMGVLRAVRETGRKVPEDVALVGFDGSSLAEAANLSSVYMPAEQEAAAAVRRLLDPSLAPEPRLPTTLAVRGSS